MTQENNKSLNNDDFVTLLIRLDERTKLIQDDLLRLKVELKDNRIETREVNAKLEQLVTKAKSELDDFSDAIKAEMETYKDTINNSFVRKEIFNPIQLIIYGMVGLILSGVLTAALTLLVKH